MRRDSSLYCPACGFREVASTPEIPHRQWGQHRLPCVTESHSHKPQARERRTRKRRRRKEQGLRDFQVPLALCWWVQLTPVQEDTLLPSLRAEIYCLPWKPKPAEAAAAMCDGMVRPPRGCKETAPQHLETKGERQQRRVREKGSRCEAACPSHPDTEWGTLDSVSAFIFDTDTKWPKISLVWKWSLDRRTLM